MSREKRASLCCFMAQELAVCGISVCLCSELIIAAG